MDRYFFLLCVLGISLLATTSSGSGLDCPGMSQEARDNAMIIKQNLNITGYEGKCTPVYRLDLAKKYIAYYVLLTYEDYIIMSAGKKTDDCKIVVQAKLPSPVAKLDEASGNKCKMYYLVSEDGTMICKDKKGKAVAIYAPGDDDALKDILEDYDSLDDFIDARAKDWKNDWKERAQRCSKSEEKKDEKKKKKKKKNKKKTRSESQEDGEDVECNGIQAGDTETIPLNGAVNQVQIVLLPQQNNDATLASLCSAIQGCSVDNDVGIISPTPDGQFDLVLSSDAPADALFNVVIKYSSGSDDEERCYQVMEAPSGKGYQYTSWSGFTYCWIYDSWKFPYYCDVMYGGCRRGTGGRVWAQIFGYYDRWTLRGGECLYTSGWNGVSGGSCSLKAPFRLYSSDIRLIRYIDYLSDLTRTSCSGVTNSGYMGNVAGFWRWKQSYGNPRIIRKDRDDAWVVNLACKHWPVAVFHKHYNGNVHAHTVIGTRWRRYYKRLCHYHYLGFIRWWVCHSWTAVYDRDYYLNYGYCNGSGNGWYNMNNLYAGAAVY